MGDKKRLRSLEWIRRKADEAFENEYMPAIYKDLGKEQKEEKEENEGDR